ncbi:hypothetical protein KSP40_PGU017473 [Platanthera guangdongensis]|uniref:Uncharacterized protein n=1 Tax=Platanthera guangdongensis TaxID=2320717 RepID=A0ABR2LP60_9ASPA
MNSSADTVHAAAAAIASAESRVQQATIPRRRWNSFFNLYSCFGSHCHSKRISSTVLVPDPTPAQIAAPPPENSSQPPSIVFPFIAPPSSPVSFQHSAPPSAIQTPAGGITLSALSSDIYSPDGRPSIFAIGPYANETQLVSPPVFSTFTTEPSTAPITPPPELLQFTTPSSPEVPFAKFLGNSYEFNSYQLYPGSPVGHLISPNSVCSGTSSPFPSRDFPSLQNGALHELVARSTFSPTKDTTSSSQDNEPFSDRRVSFELTAEEVARAWEGKQFSRAKLRRNCWERRLRWMESGMMTVMAAKAAFRSSQPPMARQRKHNLDHSIGSQRIQIQQFGWRAWGELKLVGR